MRDPRRSCFMTSSGDPYVLLNSLSYFHIWEEEIDELWIVINSTMEREVMAELIKRVSIHPKIQICYMSRRLGYGKPLDVLLDISPKGNVLLLEDDTIIFKKGILDKYFKMLEEKQYDVIGSPRMSCTPAIAEKLKQEFGLNYEGRGDRGPNFWPCFFFARKELLLQTDRNFDPTDLGDCFVWMSIQLRRLTNKILEIPQYHCSPDDFINKENNWSIFDGECGYMHLGSLSSGIESYLSDENNIALTDRESGFSAEPKPIDQSNEMKRRVMWWKHCFERSKGFLPWFDSVYLGAIIKLSSQLKESELNEWENMYMEVINDIP